MKTLSEIKSIYFIGIGGIGMSALARFFNSRGVKISGYDKTPSPLTDELIHEGIEIHFEENISLIPKEVDLVVYTPAVPAEHKELIFYRANNYEVMKRSDLLEQVTKDSFTIAVAGTHGKTTTTSLIAHLLKSSGYDCTAFLGGISVNYNSNFLSGKNNVIVVEADEYDRSFLKLHPDIAIITSADADHLDIYGSGDEVVKSFIEFAHQIKKEGRLIVKHELPLRKNLFELNQLSYSVSDYEADFTCTNEQLLNGTFQFDLIAGENTISEIHLGVAGMHNVENAIAAAAVGLILKIPVQKIREALASFRGVKRRFEYIIRRDDLVFIDDYAHHPQEIHAFLNAVRQVFPDKKITCIFQPHLYTRTRDFADGFAESLSLAHEIFLLPIYPAREVPIPGVSSEMIRDKMEGVNVHVIQKENLIRELASSKPEVIVTVGAGDIDSLVEPIRKYYEK